MANKILIASGKGGVGKSSLTVGLCRAFRDMGKRVLAMDCDIGLRSLDLLLRTGDSLVFDWGDVARGSCEPQKAILQTDGFSLLPAPLRIEETFSPARLKEMIAQLEADFDYIFIDASAGVAQELQLAACMADAALVVATSDALCLRSAGKTGEALRRFGVTEQRLVLNRFQKSAVEHCFLLNIDEAIDRSGIQLIGIVPEDPEITFRFPKGETLPKKSPAKRAFERIAKRVDGKRVPLKIV